MKMSHAYASASGSSAKDCHVIARRWAGDALSNGTVESFVVQILGGQFNSVISGGFDDLWRSPSGAVFVAAQTDVIWSATPVQGGPSWQTYACGPANGVWGLDDSGVFTWGGAWRHAQVSLFDGSSWRPIGAPDMVLRLHGVRPDLVYAVGDGGLIARWDGHTWHEVVTEIGGPFTDVFVASEHEMYAIWDRKQIWEGSIHGWSPRTEPTEARVLKSIAAWHGRVLVGTEHEGLCVLEGTTLRSVKPNVSANRMDVRGNLVLTAHDVLAETSDGERYEGYKLDSITRLLKDRKPSWL